MITTILLTLAGLAIGAVVAAMTCNNRISQLKYQNGVLKTKLDNAYQRTDELNALHATELERLRKDQKEQLEQQLALMKEQINSSSEEILHKRQQQLETTSRQALLKIVDPLQTELKRMQEIVDKATLEHSNSMSRLDSAIKSNIMQVKDVGEKADRLAQALSGESKTQGDFGELRLKQLLDDMGFEEGLQYEQQVTLRDERDHAITDSDGHRLQPDVILHFPEKRDIIIDSKVSLTAFKDYYAADDEQQRKEAMKRHVGSVRKHIDELARKDYSKYLCGNKLDFVIMYVFSESALQLALSAEPQLYKEAYEKHVILCGSNNLYALLRVLETSWKQMQQVENHQKIFDAANIIVERVQLFAERFQRVEDSLASTQKAIDEVKRSTSNSGQSIVVAANKLVKIGASESKRHKALPKDSTAQ